MPIDLEYEISEMTPALKIADGYLACEQVVIQNVRKQLKKGCSDENILKYLRWFPEYYKSKITETQNIIGCTNFRYVEGFVNTLIKMPYRKAELKTLLSDETKIL